MFALGFGAAALFGLVGAPTGSAVGKAAAGAEDPQLAPRAGKSEDAALFAEVLNSGRSLVVVRTESPETAKAASEIRDRVGLGLRGQAPGRMQANVRHAHGVAIVDVSGRITIGEGNVKLREVVRELVDQGHRDGPPEPA